MKAHSLSDRPFNSGSHAIAHSLPSPSGVIAWIWAICRSVTEVLLKDDDIRIWQIQDSHGQPYWKVHHRVSGQTAILLNEADVRCWIEQQYSNPG